MEKPSHDHVGRFLGHKTSALPDGSIRVSLCIEMLNCDLDTLCKNNPEGFVRSTTADYARQTCLALEYLHSKGIIHGDVNPNSILIT